MPSSSAVAQALSVRVRIAVAADAGRYLHVYLTELLTRTRETKAATAIFTPI